MPLPLSRLWSSALDRLVDDDLSQRIDRLGVRVNDFGYDRWGVSPQVAKRVLSIVGWLYRNYFRVEVSGLEALPPQRVLLVGNHSAQMAYDGVLVAASLVLEAEPPRLVHAMIERFFADAPLVNIGMTRLGQITGAPLNAERLLMEEEAAVLVFPEGHRGGGRVWRDRYKIMGFSQGFMRLALKTRTPIVPFGFVGGEEMCASFSRLEPLAKLFGTPYFPLTATVLPVPLPTKVHIAFGEPIELEGNGDEEDDVVLPMVHRVETAVKSLIDGGLARRRGIFW